LYVSEKNQHCNYLILQGFQYFSSEFEFEFWKNIESLGGFAPGFVNYTKGCTRLAATSNQVYQLLAHGRWFSRGTPSSSTTKTGRHNIAEILLMYQHHNS
jgi:hypothetical protein